MRILFICQGKASRSLMAEAFARRYDLPGIEVCSAVVNPEPQIHSLAVEVMREEGIELGDTPPPSLDDIPIFDIDAVVTLFSDAQERGGFLLPGQPTQINWSLPNPFEAEESGRLEAFRTMRDSIREHVDTLFKHGYLSALAGFRDNTEFVFDSLQEGVIVHDLKRRILCFNSAAEAITGYSREEVLGHDCHEIFEPSFCGGKCSFCDGSAPVFDQVKYPLRFTNRDGERKDLEMCVRAVSGAAGKMVGVLAAFRDVTRENAMARRLGEIEQFSGIIGRDHKMLEVFDLVRSVADSNAPVLVLGESGTGKELVAAAIHNESPRANNLFVPVNCGALPEGLLESELFGHVRGAFTGAIRDKKGRFELADKGTIFLDEIGDISPAMQVKLLRVLQEGTFERVGDHNTIKVDVRLVSATNKNLLKEIEAGRFREDLYYRLCVVPVQLPPLRERRADIPLLVAHILQRAAAQAGRDVLEIHPDAMDMMLAYDWPGNVRELQNAIQYGMVKSRGQSIGVSDLPPAILGQPRPLRIPDIEVPPPRSAAPPPAAPPKPKESSGGKGRRRKLTVAAVRDALDASDGNKVKATKQLGVSRATLYRFLDEHPELA